MVCKYKWLLFDADGTLLDYEQSEKHALEQAFKLVGLEMQTQYLEKYQKINAFLWSELEEGKITSKKLRVKRFELLLDELKLKYDTKAFSNNYLEALGQTGFLINGARTLLEKLHGDVKMAIITNGIKETQQNRFRKAGLNKYFEEVIISEEAGIAKPDKGFFDYTMDKIDFHNKKELLIIGDSLSSDILGGKLSGIDTCWFNPKGKENKTDIKASFVIRALDEALELIVCP